MLTHNLENASKNQKKVKIFLIMPIHPVALVMGWIGSLNVHLDTFSFGVHCIFDC